MSAKSYIRKTLRKFGVDLVQFRPAWSADARRKQLLDIYSINLALDVGANTGRYGRSLRSSGYAGEICSFEPVSAARAVLEKAASKDPRWEVFPFALGARDEVAEIHVAANSESSSLARMLPRHVEVAPSSHVVGSESVAVRRLDSVLRPLLRPDHRIFLKIDTQGHEWAVLDGAERTLQSVYVLQFEASLVPLYADESLWPDLHERVSALGFALAGVESGFRDDRTGHLLQLDATYVRG